MNNLKFALLTLIVISEKTETALEDGVISWKEGAGIGFSAIGLVKVFRNIKTIAEEFQSLTPEMKSELAIWFKEEFDFINDNLEVIVEEIFAALIQMNDLFGSLKQLK